MTEGGRDRAELGGDPAVDELAAAYATGNLVLFTGAGVATTLGLPSWRSIVTRLLEHPRLNEAAPGEMDEIRDLLVRDNVVDALTLLKRCVGPNEFGLLIERYLDDQRFEKLSELALAIGGLRPRLRGVLTTNLDNVIERAFNGEWPALSRATPNIGQRRRFILKLHGTLLDRSTWVITREDYERVKYADPIFRNILAAMFRTHAILFVGYEFADDDVEQVLAEARALSGEQAPRHFALIPEDESNGPYRRRRLEAAGVRLLIYPNPDGKHRAAADILHRISSGPESEKSVLAAAPSRFAGCPFPGLQTFNEDAASVFFGRESEINDAMANLGWHLEGQRRWLQIEGPSGVGKSSLARAGIIPAVRRGWIAGGPDDWYVATMRPGRNPLLNLGYALHEVLHVGALDALVARLHDHTDALAGFVENHIPERTGLLLVVDQLEEIFTMSPAADRTCFDSLLAAALRDKSRRLYLLTTIRSDYTARLGELPHLQSLLNAEASRYCLTNMSTLGLRRAVMGPAQLGGLTWEEGLPEQILEDAGFSEGRLPLVAHVLRMLWERREGNILTRQAYDELGHVSGALTRAADALVDHLGAQGRERVRKLLLALVRSGRGKLDTRRTITRAEALDAAGGDHIAEDVLLRVSGARGPEALDSPAAVRLVVVTEGDGQEDRVDLVHEALLREWRTFREWIDTHRKEIEQQEDLITAATEWHRAGEAEDFLPTGAKLAYLREANVSGELTRRFLHAANRVERRRVRRKRMILGAFAALLGLGAYQLHERLQARDRELAAMHASHAMLLAERGGREIDALVEAIHVAAPALSERREQPPIVTDAVSSTVLAAQSSFPLRWMGDGDVDDPAYALTVTADQRRVFVIHRSAKVRVWDLESRRLLFTLAGHEPYHSMDHLFRGCGGSLDPDSVQSPVMSVSVTPDDREIVTAGVDGTVRTWDAGTGELLATLGESKEGHCFSAISPNGLMAITPASNSTVAIWDVLSRTVHSFVDLPNPVGLLLEPNLLFSPDSTRLILPGEHGMRIVEPLTGEVLGIIDSELSLQGASFCGGGRMLVAPSTGNVVGLWDLPTGRQDIVFRGHTDNVVTTDVSPDCQRVMTGSADHTARLWNGATGAPIAELRGHTKSITKVRYAPQNMLTMSVDGKVRRWTGPGELRTTHDVGAAEVWAAQQILWRGARITLTASDDGIVRIWNDMIGSSVLQRRFAQGPIHDVGFTPDDAAIVFVATLSDGSVGMRVSDARSGKFIHAMEVISAPPAKLGENAEGRADSWNDACVRFSPDYRRVLIGDAEGNAILYDVLSGRPQTTLRGHLKKIAAAAFSPDGTVVITGSYDNTTRLWNAHTGEYLASLGTLSAVVNRIVFSPDGRRVLVAATGGDHYRRGGLPMDRIWDIQSQRVIAELDGDQGNFAAAAFSPTGRFLVATRNPILGWSYSPALWDLENSATPTQLVGHTGIVWVVAFAPDGSTLATGGDDSSVRIWSQDGSVLKTLFVPTGPVRVLRYSPSGSILLASSGDSIHLWDTRTWQSLAKLRGVGGIAHASFSRDENYVISGTSGGAYEVFPATLRDFVIQSCQLLRWDPSFTEIASLCTPFLSRQYLDVEPTTPKPVLLSGDVTQVQGYRHVFLGDRCLVRVAPVVGNTGRCHVMVTCGTTTLYGGMAGYNECKIDGDALAVPIRDGKGAISDGDPLLDIDPQTRRVIVRDDSFGDKYLVEIELSLRQ